MVVIVADDKMLLQKSDEAGSKMEKEFDYLLKLSEKSAERLWENEKDNVWNNPKYSSLNESLNYNH